VRRWRRHLADERAEGAVYRELAARRSGEEREILLGLAAAEQRHERHWEQLLGDDMGRIGRGSLRTRVLAVLARRFGGVFVLALAQQAEARTEYADEPAAPANMLADERIHGEVVRGLATRSRRRMSGTFRAAVFGANDGLVSNLALILGIGASGATHGIVLLSGFAGLLAGALSMGAGEYVSVSSQRELLDAENPAPESHGAIGDLDVNANELALVYRARGMSEQEALDHAASVLADYTHGTILAEDIDAAEHEAIGTPWGAALSSFLFFASGAFIPIVPFLFGAQQYVAVALSTSLVGMALLLTGACVGVLSGSSPMRRALRQLAIGLGAAAATYALGLAFGGGA
jgi:VIT1/CCC1 family predicted Fe2+/Mn2+ transporter